LIDFLPSKHHIIAMSASFVKTSAAGPINISFPMHRFDAEARFLCEKKYISLFLIYRRDNPPKVGPSLRFISGSSSSIFLDLFFAQ
jgi:hypothetical protein